jgi:NADPH:quinone reductase-like Zn-dependent oxidoreductase
MKAFIINRYTKKGKLQLMEMPEPMVKDNDVLVQVHAAAVNLLDTKLKSGEFKLILPYKLPFVLGHDVAGVVVKSVQRLVI